MAKRKKNIIFDNKKDYTKVIKDLTVEINNKLGLGVKQLSQIYGAIVLYNSTHSNYDDNYETQSSQSSSNGSTSSNNIVGGPTTPPKSPSEERKIKRRRQQITRFFAKIIRELGSVAISGVNKWIDIEDRVKKLGRSIGLSHEQVRGYQQDILNNYGSMAAKLGMTIDDLTSFQEKYTKATGRAIQLTKDEVKTLASASKLVGEVATNKIVENMDNFGASTKTATSYLALNMARARATGLDAQKASEAFADNIKMASKYTFSEGVNGISKMTLLSQKLKFNMESIGDAAEKFETIEGAISTAANLQVLGGTFAQQFSNPLEAMNMAMLDLEGFTDKVINSVKGKATFNRETGQIDMSALDKRFIKEASKQLGVSYEEMFNMAVQPTRIREIERELRTDQQFNEVEKAFIANKAVYDPESGNFKIAYFDEKGSEQQADISKLSKQQLREIQQQHDIDKAIYGDIHSIHGMLQDYLQKEGHKSVSMKEHLKGLGEASATTVANASDWFMHPISNGIKEFSSKDNVGLKTLIGGFVGGLGIHAVKNLINDRVGRMINSHNFGGGGSHISGGLGQKILSGAKSVGKTLIGKNKVGGVIGKIGVGATGVISSINAISDIIEQNRGYDEKIKEIERSSLSKEEKAKAKAEATEERNENRGESIGSAVGAIAGSALGIMGGPIGVAIGGYVGEWVGSGLGKWIGGFDMFNDDSKKLKENKSLTENAQPIVNDYNSPNSPINEDNKKYLAVSHISNSVDSINGYLSVLVKNNNGRYIQNGGYSETTYLSPNSENNDVNNSIRENSNNSSYTSYINNDKNYVMTSGVYSGDIVSVPTIGTPTYVNPIDYNRNNFTSNNTLNSNNNINLNVNGSLRLIGDNNSANIDINRLLSDNNFMNQLKSILIEALGKKGGISHDKHSLGNMTNTYDSNVSYGNTRMI